MRLQQAGSGNTTKEQNDDQELESNDITSDFDGKALTDGAEQLLFGEMSLC